MWTDAAMRNPGVEIHKDLGLIKKTAAVEPPFRQVSKGRSIRVADRAAGNQMSPLMLMVLKRAFKVFRLVELSRDSVPSLPTSESVSARI